jgi:hypothetical protein
VVVFLAGVDGAAFTLLSLVMILSSLVSAALQAAPPSSSHAEARGQEADEWIL